MVVEAEMNTEEKMNIYTYVICFKNCQVNEGVVIRERNTKSTMLILGEHIERISRNNPEAIISKIELVSIRKE